LLPALDLYLVRHLCLLAAAVACVYTDLARGKLYNLATLGGLALGLIIGLWLDARADGFPHLKNALLAALAGGGLLYLVYLTGGLGAGDVKLMAAVGALSGRWDFTLTALMYAALVGAAIAIGTLIWQGRLRQGLKASMTTLFTFRVRRPEGTAPLTIPYGVAIGVGTVWAWIERFALR